MTEPQRSVELKVTYTSPTNAPLTLTTPLTLPSQSSVSVADKTAYLSALRGAVADLQARVNTELTARMEEDKAREADTTVGEGKKSKENKQGKAAKAVDEAVEEENYGEEVTEED